MGLYCMSGNFQQRLLSILKHKVTAYMCICHILKHWRGSWTIFFKKKVCVELVVMDPAKISTCFCQIVRPRGIVWRVWGVQPPWTQIFRGALAAAAHSSLTAGAPPELGSRVQAVGATAFTLLVPPRLSSKQGRMTAFTNTELHRALSSGRDAGSWALL